MSRAEQLVASNGLSPMLKTLANGPALKGPIDPQLLDNEPKCYQQFCVSSGLHNQCHQQLPSMQNH
uniref:Uncharacterized protein n=1 Tax=Romanomermis culicivorax TaxID=13658 RepID=A0A915KEP3_ROMCU